MCIRDSPGRTACSTGRGGHGKTRGRCRPGQVDAAAVGPFGQPGVGKRQRDCATCGAPVGYKDRSVSVSYTHLDVYKRQTQRSADAIAFRVLSSLSGHRCPYVLRVVVALA